jgi:hypothetical protein
VGNCNHRKLLKLRLKERVCFLVNFLGRQSLIKNKINQKLLLGIRRRSKFCHSKSFQLASERTQMKLKLKFKFWRLNVQICHFHRSIVQQVASLILRREYNFDSHASFESEMTRKSRIQQQPNKLLTCIRIRIKSRIKKDNNEMPRKIQ